MKPPYKWSRYTGSPTEAFDVAAYLARDPVERWRSMLRVEGSWSRVYVWRARARLTPEIIEALRLEGLTPSLEWADLDHVVASAAAMFARTL